MNINFSTKARTLSALKPVIHGAAIAPLHYFTVEEWRKDNSACLSGLAERLGAGPWIVRSSCLKEDGNCLSNAGAFLSVLDVQENDIAEAVERVITSYGKENLQDEVLVQPMLKGVLRSGVAFSHDPHTVAPYRVVNWSEGKDTSAITGGSVGQVWQQAARSKVKIKPSIKLVIDLIDELLTVFDNTPLDCEFAFTRDGDKELLWLLQVRPLVMTGIPEAEEDQAARLKKIEAKIELGMNRHPFLMGQSTVYGVMPDWNPAEIIGVRPRPLALSLYRDLITDNIWAYQRDNYGYRNLRSFPLMPHFFGLPYIDVRLSFNSFIPATLKENLANRLVDHYIDRLLAEPTLHDKVEFEIVFSCYTLDLPQRLARLSDVGFSKDEQVMIADSLRGLTNRIMHSKDGLWIKDASKINELDTRREQLLSSNTGMLERIYWLLEDAKRYGTLPFAGLARAGFIAVQLLRSLVEVGVFSEADYNAFLAGISTVSGQLAHDRCVLDNANFLKRYGHLRPGTYDILSKRYDEEPELYMDIGVAKEPPRSSKPFGLTLAQMREIKRLLETHDLEIDPVELLEFIQTGIEQREFSKFQFTRNLSSALALITEVGSRYGFTRDNMSYCDIGVIKELHIGAGDEKDILRRSIDQGKVRYYETQKISLPPLIAKPEDVWGFEWPSANPNYITQLQVTAPVLLYGDNREFDGAIVCIENADPGYDWLFSYRIAGLITAWGGVNSHMAIRAGELGLPAVIGAGEALFRIWSGASRLHIDCAGRRVEIIE